MITHLCALLVLSQVISFIKVSPHHINMDYLSLSGLVQGVHTESDAKLCNLLTFNTWSGYVPNYRFSQTVSLCD